VKEMNLFENLQLMNEQSKTLDEIAKEIENKFYEKFKAKFGVENELHTNMLFSATKNISDEYFSEGYDIKLTVNCSPLISSEFKEFIYTFANEFSYDVRDISSSQIDILIKVDEI
jgi:hypothetical protein